MERSTKYGQGMLNLGDDLAPIDAAMDVISRTSCEHCKQVLYRHENVLVVTKHFSGHTAQFHFCGERCANEFYLERLRGGL